MKNKRLQRITAFALTVALAVSVLCSCSAKPVDEIERTSFLFDTIISIKLRCSADAESILEESFDLCERCDKLFDRYDPESDIFRINHSGGTPCEVSSETAELIGMAPGYSRISGGRYDISCGRVTALWDFAAESPIVPDASALKAALATVDWQSITLEGSTVTVPDGTELDLGGIAKGYIADRLVDHLRSSGVRSAIINLGGNVYALGDKDGQPYKVGIQSPFGSGSLGHVSVSDCSVVTAGSYQRCFELDGKLYHHILDLTDGMPSRSGLASVTVISESSAQADALATVCFILGLEDGMRLIESTDSTEALFVTEDGQIHMTDGARAVTTLY